MSGKGRMADEAVLEAHKAICEDSMNDCLEWGGRCVKAVEAAAPFIAAKALEDAAGIIGAGAGEAPKVISKFLRARAAAERGEG